MINQYTLKVYPLGRGRQVYRTIEICGKDTLDTLCSTIIDSFDLYDEHLYEYCMDNRMYSRNSYQSSARLGDRSTNINLDKLDLVKGQKFSLHYDFGDDWMFPISVVKIEQVDQPHHPRIIKEKGSIKQYPM